VVRREDTHDDNLVVCDASNNNTFLGSSALSGWADTLQDVTATPPPPHDGPDIRPGFLERDPVALAAEANLGDGGPAKVAYWQDIYWQIFDLIGYENWPQEPEGPLANHWRGVGGAQRRGRRRG
jgi:hypothetical protein